MHNDSPAATLAYQYKEVVKGLGSQVIAGHTRLGTRDDLRFVVLRQTHHDHSHVRTDFPRCPEQHLAVASRHVQNHDARRGVFECPN